MVSRSSSNDSRDSLERQVERELLGEEMPSGYEERTQQAGPAGGSTFSVQSSATTLSDAIARQQASQPSPAPFTFESSQTSPGTFFNFQAPQPSPGAFNFQTSQPSPGPFDFQATQPSPSAFNFQTSQPSPGPFTFQPSPLPFVGSPSQSASEETPQQIMKMEVEREGETQDGKRKQILKPRLRRPMGTSEIAVPSPPMTLSTTPGPLTSVPAVYSFAEIAAKEKESLNAASHQALHFQNEHAQKQLAELRNKNDETIKQKDEVIATKESQRSQLAEELAAIKERYGKLKNTHEKSVRGEKGYQDRLSTQETVIQAFQKEADDAYERVQEANKRTGEAVTELNHYKQQLSHCEETLNSVRGGKRSLQTQFDNLKEREKQIRAQAGEFGRRMKEAEAKLNNYPQEIVSLEAERDRFKAGLDVAQENLADVKNDFKELKHERTEAESEFIRIKNELADMEKNSNQINQLAKNRENEIDTLRAEIGRLKKSCEDKDENIMLRRMDITALKNKAKNVSKENDETIRNLRMEITSLEGKLASANEEVSKEKTERIELLETEITALKEQLATINEKIANHSASSRVTQIKERIPTKNPISLPPSFAGEDDEWSRRMENYVQGEMTLESEEEAEEKDDVEGVEREQPPALSHSRVVTTVDVAPKDDVANVAKEQPPPLSHSRVITTMDIAPKDDVEKQLPALTHSGVVTTMAIAPTIFSYPPVPRASPTKVTTPRSLPLSVCILSLLLLTWLGWTFVMGRMDRRHWIAANQGTRRAW